MNRRPSIRRHTALLVAGAFTLVLLAGGFSLWTITRSALMAEFDATLAARADALQTLTRFEHGHVEMDFAEGAAPSVATMSAGGIPPFVAWKHVGGHWQELAATPGTQAHPTAFDTSQDAAFNLSVTGPRSLVRDFIPVVDREDLEHAPSPVDVPTVRLLVMQDQASLKATLAVIGWCILGVGAVLVAAAIGASWLAVSRGLQPLRELSVTISNIDAESLETPLEAGVLPAELEPIAAHLNATLSRLSEAFQREKRFTAAAAHELRTPLAELRMMLEVALGKDRSPDYWQQTAADAVAVTTSTEALLVALLAFARGTQARLPKSSDAAYTDVRVILEEELWLLKAKGWSQVEASMPPSESASVDADESSIRMVVRNLLTNAMRHSDPGSKCLVKLSVTDSCVRFEVLNHASALAADDLPHLFEPFWRKDASRSRDGGSGLGLAVCRSLLLVHGGSIDAALVAGLLTMEVKWAWAAIDFRQPAIATRPLSSASLAGRQLSARGRSRLNRLRKG